MQSERQPPDSVFKLLVIGDSTVGKSCLILRYVDIHGSHEPSFIPTIGVDFKVKTIEVDSKRVRLQIWDTAGQERFNNIVKSYYRGSHGILVVYDVTNRETFDHVSKWLRQAEEGPCEDAVRFLVGNKVDLTDRQVVSEEEGRALATERSMQFMQTSAKTGACVEEAFLALTKLCLEKEAFRPPQPAATGTAKPIIMEGPKRQESKRWWC